MTNELENLQLEIYKAHQKLEEVNQFLNKLFKEISLMLKEKNEILR